MFSTMFNLPLGPLLFGTVMGLGPLVALAQAPAFYRQHPEKPEDLPQGLRLRARVQEFKDSYNRFVSVR